MLKELEPQKRPFHILEAQQFTRTWLEGEFFEEVRRAEKGPYPLLKGKSICILFYEPSTRTRLSFEQAAARLGLNFSSTENARDFSSAIKGESLKDTVRVANALGFDAIVLRYHEEGGAKEAAGVSEIPIINAGDGPGQHPTQALLDIYTIQQHFGALDGIRVALVGDLKNGRTVRSLAYLLSKFKNVRLDLVSPQGFEMRKDILDHLDERGVSYQTYTSLSDVAASSDVVYLTRAQKERLGEDESLSSDNNVRLTAEILNSMPRNCIIMHPLPRSEDFNELPEELTSDPRVVIFKQVANGLYARMALLKMVLT